MKTSIVFFPFDLFGSGGTGRGAELLADAFREMLADNQHEKVHTRARAYAGKIQLEEFSFETLLRDSVRSAFPSIVQMLRGQRTQVIRYDCTNPPCRDFDLRPVAKIREGRYPEIVLCPSGFRA